MLILQACARRKNSLVQKGGEWSWIASLEDLWLETLASYGYIGVCWKVVPLLGHAHLQTTGERFGG